MKNKGFKHDRKRGDKLLVKLRDTNYNPIYEKEVETNNLKELALLIKDLKDKGVPIEKAIKKGIEIYDDWFW